MSNLIYNLKIKFIFFVLIYKKIISIFDIILRFRTAQDVLISTLLQKVNETLEEESVAMAMEQQQYEQDTTFEVKPSLWQRFKNSKIVRAATFLFKIKVRIELPSNALPEGRGEN